MAGSLLTQCEVSSAVQSGEDDTGRPWARACISSSWGERERERERERESQGRVQVMGSNLKSQIWCGLG
jgi:hypothetical protein